MNHDLNHDALLNDLLSETASPQFRAETLAKTLGAVHRRKLRRRLAPLSATVALLALLVLGSTFWHASKPFVSPNPNPLFIHSESLTPQMWVSTLPANVDLVHTSDSTVILLSTSGADPAFQVISDKQLLALLGGRPAALVYRAPQRAQLVFSNPAQENGFPAP